jgi:hypothetical protein
MHINNYFNDMKAPKMQAKTAYLVLLLLVLSSMSTLIYHLVKLNEMQGDIIEFLLNPDGQIQSQPSNSPTKGAPPTKVSPPESQPDKNSPAKPKPSFVPRSGYYDPNSIA